MKSILKLVWILLLTTTLANAADSSTLPDAPGKFWTKENAVLLVADALAKSQDAYRTDANLSIGGRETDPLTRPFVTHGTALRASFFAGCLLMDTFVAYELTKHHRQKLAKVVLLGGIAYSTSGAVASTTAHTPMY